MSAPKFTSIGGQAVIEGVMMRSPGFIAVAVRQPDQKIVIRHTPYTSIASRYPVLKKPFIRGVTTLIESMAQGMEALGFSAEVSAEAEAPAANGESKGTRAAIALSMAVAIVFGLGLFVALPHLLTAWIASRPAIGISVESPLFHALDGLLKLLILLTYVFTIGQMKDIHRVFQYHGAEHKSIYAFEAGEELTVENARKHTRLHPRCGTSFLLFLVVISIAVFTIVLPVAGLTRISANPILNHLGMVVAKVVLMLPVAGIAYEFIKLCAGQMQHPFFRALVWPGLVLQNLTTREPADEQLEVALASLRKVLVLEKSAVPAVAIEPSARTIISALGEIAWVPATVAEFPEA